MSKHEFCPECGIGISTKEIRVGFCENCRTDIREKLAEEELLWDDSGNGFTTGDDDFMIAMTEGRV